mmetsp:Transcript_37213/g.111397  ORF Transcript_37213/g.111397 Transcript_37213/m.111397 type:complete len:263 (-) Transcript_37213:976-1764(-)
MISATSPPSRAAAHLRRIRARSMSLPRRWRHWVAMATMILGTLKHSRRVATLLRRRGRSPERARRLFLRSPRRFFRPTLAPAPSLARARLWYLRSPRRDSQPTLTSAPSPARARDWYRRLCQTDSRPTSEVPHRPSPARARRWSWRPPPRGSQQTLVTPQRLLPLRWLGRTWVEAAMTSAGFRRPSPNPRCGSSMTRPRPPPRTSTLTLATLGASSSPRWMKSSTLRPLCLLLRLTQTLTPISEASRNRHRPHSRRPMVSMC